MKRTLLALAALWAATAFACGGDDGEPESPATPGPAVTQPSVAPDLTTAPEVETALAGAPTVTIVDTSVAIDADGATDEIEAQREVAVGEEFTVLFTLTEAGGDYQGYQFDIMWDPAVLAYVSVNHLKPGGLETCSPTRTFDDNRVGAFCLDTELAANRYEGKLSEVTFRCAAVGQSVLHLRGPEEGNPGTKIANSGQPIEHRVTRVDATISCG